MNLKIFSINLLLFIVVTNFVFSQKKADSLEIILNKRVAIGKLDITTLKLIWKWYDAIDNKKAERTGENIALGMTIAQESKNEENLAIMFNYYAHNLLSSKNHSMAMDYYFEASKIFQKLDNRKALAYSYIYIGNAYFEQEVYELSQKYYDRGYEIFKVLDDKDGLTIAYSKKGLTKLKLECYDIALDLFFQAMRNHLNGENYLERGNSYVNISKVFIGKEDYSKAIPYLYKAVKEYENNNNLEQIADTYILLGEVYLNTKEYQNAKENLKHAFNIYSDLAIHDKIAVSSTRLGEIYHKLKNYKMAFEYGEIALSIADSIYNLGIKRDVTLLMSSVFQAMNNYKEAYKYSTLYSEIGNEEFEDYKKNQFIELHIKLETGRKQRDIENLENEKLKQIEIQNAEKVQIYTIAFGIIIVIIGFVFAFRYRYIQQDKANTILKEKNFQIEKQDEELKRVNKNLYENTKELEEANAAKDRMFSIIGHDLRNPIGTFKGMLKSLSEDFNSFEQEERTIILKELSNSANHTYNLLENLLYWAKSQRKEISFQPENVLINDLIDENIGLLQSNAREKSITLHVEMNEKITVFVDKNMITTVLRNLISNAIKFTPLNGKICIKTSTENNIIEIKDTGVGISQENIKKIFNKNEHFSTYGTNSEKGSGLGLILCKEFIDLNGGKIWVESEIEKGSSFKFILPLTETQL